MREDIGTRRRDGVSSRNVALGPSRNAALGWIWPQGRPPSDAARAPALRTRNLLALTLWLVPVNWVLGTSLLWFYALAVVMAGGMRRPCALEWTLIGLSTALALGLVAAGGGGAGADRLLAALYNLSLIVAMVIVLNAARAAAAELGPGEFAPIWRAALALLLVQVAWVLCTEALVRQLGIFNIEFRTLLLGSVGPLPGVLAEYARAVVVITDWTKAGAGPRVHGFGLYATEGALLVALAGSLAAVQLHKARRWVLLTALAEAATLAALVLMASRTTLLGYVVSSALLGGLMGRRSLPALVAGMPVILLAAGLAATAGPGLVADLFSSINESRAGSSETRFLSYRLAIDMVLEQNPLTGLGIKPRDPSLLEVPIGSHSTFVSVFTKGGFLALAFLASFYVLAIIRLAALQRRLYAGDPGLDRGQRIELVCLSRATAVLLTWWTTEDFDAPAHAALLGSLCLGLLWGLSDGRPRASRMQWGRGRSPPSRREPGVTGAIGWRRAAAAQEGRGNRTGRGGHG